MIFTPVAPTATPAALTPVQQAAPLVRTGTDVARWTILAFSLMGVGTLLFVAARRRPHLRT